MRLAPALHLGMLAEEVAQGQIALRALWDLSELSGNGEASAGRILGSALAANGLLREGQRHAWVRQDVLGGRVLWGQICVDDPCGVRRVAIANGHDVTKRLALKGAAQPLAGAGCRRHRVVAVED